MKVVSGLVVFVLLGATAAAQVHMPNPNLPGGSMNTAVRLIGTSDLMIERQIRRWLRTHYPDWTADPHEFTSIGDERYAVVYITHPDNPGRRVYFRIVRSPADPDDSSPFPF